MTELFPVTSTYGSTIDIRRDTLIITDLKYLDVENSTFKTIFGG